MTGTISPELYGDLVATASQPDFTDWLSMVKRTGGCSQPVHLWGESRTVHAGTGEVLFERAPGRLLVACGNRRKTRCPACSETYRADTFQLIKAGLVGGKAVPDTVAGHPKVFVTFTAPSFGPVHHRIAGSNGEIKPCHPHGVHRCGQRHLADDSLIGQPLDPGGYDYEGAVIWNALATRLWTRTVQLANRHAARLLGIPQRHWPKHGRVSVAKVAEFQARGLVHFHAVFRFDGPEPDALPPAGSTTDVLCEAIRHAAAHADTAAPMGKPAIVWGDQLDLRPIQDKDDGPTLTDSQVAGYVAKYATKGAEASGTADRPIACQACKGVGRLPDRGTCSRCDGDGQRHRIEELILTPHARRMIETCWDLGGRSQLEELRLRPWAHMLGFRGHFSTKSRRYSTTLSRLRQARQEWRSQGILNAHDLGADTAVLRTTVAEAAGIGTDEDAVLVIGDWRYIGHGHAPGQAVYADTIRRDLAEGRRIWKQVRPDDWETAA